jgi:hypothetical protein
MTQSEASTPGRLSHALLNASTNVRETGSFGGCGDATTTLRLLEVMVIGGEDLDKM